MQHSNAQVAVLIPYFQKAPGILEGTVRSVLAQKGFDDYHIFVVDDGSPVPARDELSEIADSQDRLTIIEQSNAGPGAARNKALDNVPADTRDIAFLDSDDRLDENYLCHAVQALDRGYDLFFGNSRRADIPGTRFDWDAEQSVHLDPARHRLLNEERALYEFTGDFFDFILHRSNIIGPSTMVYRREVGATVRYNERIYNGQDRIFKLMLCQKVQKAVFSTQVYAEEGKGVNIFDNAGWGSERALSRISSYIDMNRVILHEFLLKKSQRKHVCQHLADTRYAFTASLLHQLRCGQNIDWKLVGKTFRQDPSTLGLLLPNLIKIMANKIRISESGT